MTIFIILLVAYIFISPSFALAPSADRAWRAALQIFVVMALLSSLLLGFERPILTSDWLSTLLDTRGSPDILLKTCLSLC